MRAKFPGMSLLGLALVYACSDSIEDPLSALQKATYAEAAQSSSDGTSTLPANDGSEASWTPPPLLLDCSLTAAEGRVRTDADTNHDGTVDETEQAVLEGDFPPGEPPQGDEQHQPPLPGVNGPPPPMGGERPPPEGASSVGRHEGQRPPECTGTQTIADLAARPPPPTPHGMRGHGWRQLLFVYDTDDSGSLEQSEQEQLNDDLSTGCNARNGRLMARFDTNGDGALDEVETTTAQQTLRDEHVARVTADLTAADSNGDGSLTCDEQTAFHDARRAAHDAERAQWDTNADGTLDASEKAALREALRQRLRSGELPGAPPPP